MTTKASKKLTSFFSPVPRAVSVNRAAEDSNQVPTTATNEGAHPSSERNCDHLSDACISNLPECWNLEQGEFFKKENEWLSFVDGRLKCLSCSRVKHLGSLGRISLEWAEGGVKAPGDSKQKQQRALRKKIYQHRESDAHIKALEIDRTAKKRKLEEAFSEQLNEHQEATKKIFRIAYKQAKNCRPFSDFSDEIDVQTANGVDLGRILHTNVSCASIVDHIGNEMQKSMCRALIEDGAKFSVLIDESTTVSKHSTLIVYLRSDFGHLQPITVFLDLVEVTDGTAAGIKEALLTCLSSHGLSMNVLKEKLVAFACDGASVMLGKHSGVAKLLENTFPNLITWHCSAHRLELAVGDTVRDVQGINHFKIFMDKLYCLYSSSPKNRRELESCAKDLNASLLCVGRVLDTRWVASSFRTVNAVMTSYPSLYAHFMKCSEDPKRDTKEKAQYIGLAERLSSVEFVQNLALLHDSLAELSELSLNFQVRAITLPEAHNLVTRQIAVFEARKVRPGKMSVQVNDAVKTKCFKDIKLHPGRKCDRAINSTQFYQSLADNMRTRLLTTQSSRSSSSSVDQHVTVYRELIEDIRLLDPLTWPGELDVLYGEDKITRLAQRLGVNEKKAQHGFREYVENGGKTVPEKLRGVVTAVNCIPVSTADCERGFSAMNIIMTPMRSSLCITRLSTLLFIEVNGPPLQRFCPDSYVTLWLLSGRHSALQVRAPARKARSWTEGQEKFWKILQ
ncbi:E3 SUMO-protein ligase KIAA1586-like [Ixodes scapularis]|uniref:E3 SUMO-protein ligase KIAA1586-like n=1 Tax=Ixodes scapularis TaxID=6945 RepID=UPI001A9D59B0|nr:E3 SUMO-protein ligase KIAA1586-like [Ixodes scapularis]